MSKLQKARDLGLVPRSMEEVSLEDIDFGVFNQWVKDNGSGDVALRNQRMKSVIFETVSNVIVYNGKEMQVLDLEDGIADGGEPFLSPNKIIREEDLEMDKEKDLEEVVEGVGEMSIDEVIDAAVTVAEGTKEEEKDEKKDAVPEEKSSEFVKEEGKKSEKKEPTIADTFEGAIAKAVAGTGILPDMTDVRRFITTHKGAVMGLVTNNDRQIVASTSAVRVVDPKGGFQLKSTASEKARDLNLNYQATGKGMPPLGECVVERTPLFREKAPSPVRGVVISIPRGALEVYPDAVKKSETQVRLEPVLEHTELVTQLYPVKDVPQILSHLCGSELSESPITYGDQAGKLRVVFRASVQEDKETGEQINITRPALTHTTTGRKLVVDGAYFPINTFKTMTPGDVKNDQDKLIMDESAFVTLVRGGNLSVALTKAQIDKGEITSGVTPAYTELLDQYKEKIRLAWSADMKRPIIVSDYFGKGATEEISIAPYDDKDGVISNPEFPIKERRVSEAGKTSFRYIKFDATKAEDGEITSLDMEKFKPFREAVGDALSIENLRDLRARRGGKTRADNVISPEAAREILAANQEVVGGVEIQNVNTSADALADGIVADLAELY